MGPSLKKCQKRTKKKKRRNVDFINAGLVVNLQVINRKQADIVIQVVDSRGKLRRLRGLLDTGCTKSIFLEEFLDNSKMMQTKEGVTFKTYDGEFTAKKKNRCTFRLPEFDTHKKVTFDVVLDYLHLREESPYDAIIGLDIVVALGMDTQFSDKTICWDGETASMK